MIWENAQIIFALIGFFTVAALAVSLLCIIVVVVLDMFVGPLAKRMKQRRER